MISFEVNGHKYQATTLDIFDQMVLTKRLMPVFKGIVTPEVLGAVLAAKPGEDATKDRVRSKKTLATTLKPSDATNMLGAMADAIHGLADEDLRAITVMCLKVCQRQTAGTGGVWAPVVADNGRPMYDDIKLPDMLQIVWRVIEGHLSGFFNTAP